MNPLFLFILISAVIWVLFLFFSYYKKQFLPQNSLVNPKVNLGRVAGVQSIQGMRAHMEDSYFGDYSIGFFGVYDGHGGSRCSQFTSSNLHTLITSNPIHPPHTPQEAMTSGYLELDRRWLDIANAAGWDDGTTAVTAWIINGILYVANVGDSRAVLVSSGESIDLSHDHKPNRSDERSRIESLGGRVILYGTWRVEGVLAVSRAIGDRRLKKYVTAEPEIVWRELTESDEYLILASDGVWDVISSQTAVELVKSATDVKQAANLLTQTAYKEASQDNITAMVIDLTSFKR